MLVTQTFFAEKLPQEKDHQTRANLGQKENRAEENFGPGHLGKQQGDEYGDEKPERYGEQNKLEGLPQVDPEVGVEGDVDEVVHAHPP